MPALFVCLLIAQGTAVAPEGADLVRIRKELARQPAITTDGGTDESGRPVFRMSIRAPMPQKPLWDNWTNVPSYIRPNMPLYHYEHMQLVTPPEFRGGTFYTVGIPIGAIVETLANEIRAARYRAQERSAREEVSKALAEVLACRADPSGPGC